MKTLALSLLRIDGGTQSRAELNESTVAEYAEAIRFAVALPPITVYFDGSAYWMADGFHRYHAHRAAGAIEIDADVRDGTRRDAILHSVGANAAHGLRRTNEDKRRAVKTLLSDTEWAKWSDNAIAKACGVSNHLVDDVKKSLTSFSPSEKTAFDRGMGQLPVEKTYITKHGTEAVMQTANIGKAKDTPESAVERAPQGGMVAALPAQTKPVAVAVITVTEADELREELAELRASMKETLADNEMMGRVFDSDDRLKAAMDEAKRQKAIAENAERTLAAKNGEYIERARAVTMWMNRAQKAEKELARLTKAAA